MPPALPGGFSVGDKLYYTGESTTLASGNCIVHGEQCEIMGPADNAQPDQLNALFPGRLKKVNLQLTSLSRSPPPPLPGGFSLGEKLYWNGRSEIFPSGNRLVHGKQGEVMGPDDNGDPNRLNVHFPGNKDGVRCQLTKLNRAPPPPLPGGFSVGDKVYYTGESKTLASGGRLVHGAQGEITGPSDGAQPRPDQLNVLFPGRTPHQHVNVFLTNLSRSQPVAKYPPIIQITIQGGSTSGSTSGSTLGGSTSECLGAYELQQGHMAHGRPVWKQPGQARAIAYLGGEMGWGVQPCDQVGVSASCWLHLAAPELALPCEPTAKVWKSNPGAGSSGGWVAVEQLECVELGPPPKVLVMETPSKTKSAIGVYELQAERTAYGGPVWKHASSDANAGWCIARLPEDLGWGVQPEASVGASPGSVNWGTQHSCLILKAPQLVYPCLESPHKWESLRRTNGLAERTAELSAKCVSPPRPRFPIGTRVECSCLGGGFERGIVVQHHYWCAPPHGRSAHAYCLMCSARHLSLRRQDDFEPTQLKPYQVRLDNGRLIYAPLDEDRVIRAERNQDHKVSLAAIVHHIVHHTVHSYGTCTTS